MLCLVSWASQRGTLPLPKSVMASRIVSNLQVKYLPEGAYARPSGLERHKSFNFSGEMGDAIVEEVGDEVVRKVGIDGGPNKLVKFTI